MQVNVAREGFSGRGVRLADLLLKLVAAGFLLMLLYVGYRYRFSVRGVPVLFYLVPALGAVLALGALRMQRAIRINLALIVGSAGVALYAAELFLLSQAPADPVRRAAERLGYVYDGRSKLEVVQDLRRRGARAYPAALPSEFLSSGAYRRDLLPLGGIANATTVLCNESGPYTIYESDEHGFNNPKGIWASDRLDVAVIGDSFAQGFCVPVPAGIASQIGARWPRTLNLGMATNGPLLELAALREYLPALRPRVVLWMYYEGNDLLDLEKEKSDPLLRGYLESGLTQNLLRRQSEVDSVLAAWLDTEMRARATSSFAAGLNRKRSVLDAVRNFVTLQGVRRLLGLTAQPTPPVLTCDVPLLREILQEAKATVNSWGGTLYFVYLPSWARYHTREYSCETVRDQVLASVHELKIPLVDLHPVFQTEDNPSRLFAQQELNFTHYGVEGYRRVVRTLLDSLSAAALPQGEGHSLPVE